MGRGYSVRHREKSQEWLRFFGTIFVVVGLAVTIDGAWSASKPVVLTEQEAVEMGKDRWASRSLEENLKLPKVQALLRQSEGARRGFGFIVVGSIYQTIGAILLLAPSFVGRRRMDLSEHQLWVIRAWAMQTRYVKEVRLFGSYAKGEAAPDSDIDLAVTIGGGDEGAVLGNYVAKADHWERELSNLLEAKTHVALYNDPNLSPVYTACERCSILLLP